MGGVFELCFCGVQRVSSYPSCLGATADFWKQRPGSPPVPHRMRLCCPPRSFLEQTPQSTTSALKDSMTEALHRLETPITIHISDVYPSFGYSLTISELLGQNLSTWRLILLLPSPTALQARLCCERLTSSAKGISANTSPSPRLVKHSQCYGNFYQSIHIACGCGRPKLR